MVRCEVYKTPEDLIRMGREIQTMSELERVLQREPKVNGNEEEGKLSNAEKVKRLLYQLTMESIPCSNDQKLYLKKSVSLLEVRHAVVEFFNAFQAPRRIQYQSCFEAVGIVCRSLLDNLNQDYENSLKELYALMVVSQMLFYMDGNRKIHLSTEIDQHPVWQDIEIWKMCL